MLAQFFRRAEHWRHMRKEKSVGWVPCPLLFLMWFSLILIWEAISVLPFAALTLPDGVVRVNVLPIDESPTTYAHLFFRKGNPKLKVKKMEISQLPWIRADGFLMWLWFAYFCTQSFIPSVQVFQNSWQLRVFFVSCDFAQELYQRFWWPRCLLSVLVLLHPR